MGGAVGGIAGGLLGGLGGGGGSSRTSESMNQTRTPWDQQIPYLLEMFKRAQGSLDQAPEGHGLNQSASGQLQKTLSGDYLFGNPESQKAIDAITRDSSNRAMSGIDSKFAAGGRYGSGLHKAALGQQIADTSSAEMAKNYAAERANMMGAAGMAPGVADALDWKQHRLRDFASMVSGNFGGTTTENSTSVSRQEGGNKLSGKIGGALGGARMGRQLFS